jgi:hypothetical protein
MAGDGKSRKGRKSFKFGGKQKHGTSRAAYFAQADYRIARNKRLRIEKNEKFLAKCLAKKGA